MSIHLVIIRVINVTGVRLSPSSDGIIDTRRHKLKNGVMEINRLISFAFVLYVPGKGPGPPRHSWRWAPGSWRWWRPQSPGSAEGWPPGRASGRGTQRAASSPGSHWGPGPGWSWCHWNGRKIYQTILFKFWSRYLRCFVDFSICCWTSSNSALLVCKLCSRVDNSSCRVL